MSDAGPNSAAILTGEGTGAVGVIRVRGPSALAVVDRLFTPARGGDLAITARGRPRFGRLGDEVVALALEDDPPTVEIHGHGGPAALEMILTRLRAEGVVLETAGEAAEIALARAPTLRVAQILLDQLDGALDREIAAIESVSASDPADALARIETLLARAAIGTRLLDGWRVVLTGRPNVGKSRLLNALAGFERAIVSPRPGTTRDLVTIRTAIDGWPVEIADTAGLRSASGPIEQAGMDLAREACARADLVVAVLDRGEPLSEEDRKILDEWPAALRVANKADRPAAWDEFAIGAIPLSALTGDGLTELLAAIAGRLVAAPPPEGAAVPYLAEDIARLERFGKTRTAERRR